MDIRSGVDGLKALLGAAPAASAQTQQAKGESAATTNSVAGDRATLSNAGAEVSQSASAPDIRMDKVAAVQAALAAGTYNVPASAVASKVVDSMLGGSSSGS